MLDCYWLLDCDISPQEPDQTRHLGALSLQEYMAMRHMWDQCLSQGIELPFTQDSRLSCCQVKKMLVLANEAHAAANKGMQGKSSKPVVNCTRLCFGFYRVRLIDKQGYFLFAISGGNATK